MRNNIDPSSKLSYTGQVTERAMTDLEQRPYVPAKQLNSKYPVGGPQRITLTRLIGHCSSSTMIRTYITPLCALPNVNPATSKES